MCIKPAKQMLRILLIIYSLFNYVQGSVIQFHKHWRSKLKSPRNWSGELRKHYCLTLLCSHPWNLKNPWLARKESCTLFWFSSLTEQVAWKFKLFEGWTATSFHQAHKFSWKRYDINNNGTEREERLSSVYNLDYGCIPKYWKAFFPEDTNVCLKHFDQTTVRWRIHGEVIYNLSLQSPEVEFWDTFYWKFGRK